MVKGVLLDLGGVVYVGNEPIPGAIDAIGRLRAAGVAIRFLTNTTRSPCRHILQKLAAMGLDVRQDEIFTPAMAARTVIESNGYEPHFLIHPHLREDFANLPSGDKRAVVVGDAGEAFSYQNMNAAFRELEQGAAFFALANNRSFRDDDGGLSLDAGPFVAALSFASRRDPVILGKPSAEFFVAALQSMDCSANEAAMVGDDVESDVGGALAAGIAGVLVQTGKYADGDESRIEPPPSHVAPDLKGAVDWLLNQ